MNFRADNTPWLYPLIVLVGAGGVVFFLWMAGAF